VASVSHGVRLCLRLSLVIVCGWALDLIAFLRREAISFSVVLLQMIYTSEYFAYCANFSLRFTVCHAADFGPFKFISEPLLTDLGLRLLCIADRGATANKESIVRKAQRSMPQQQWRRRSS
jgi:hypothetical protein